MKTLNRRTRGIRRSTNVLSFPLHRRRPYSRDPDGKIRLGDIVVSVPAARRQARARGTTLRREVRGLIVHGLLHLVGFDHRHAREEAQMNRTARRLLRVWEVGS